MKVNQIKLTPDVWGDVPIEKVGRLPYDIEGLKIYIIEYDNSNETTVTEDGRQWCNYTMSRPAGFTGKRYLKSCKGSHRCENQHCGYFR